MHAATKSALICSHGSLISHVQAVTLRKHNIGKLGAISFCLWCYKYIPFLFCVCFDWTWLCGDSQAISRLMSLPRLFVGRWSIFMHVVQSYSVINENMFAFECHSSDLSRFNSYYLWRKVMYWSSEALTLYITMFILLITDSNILRCAGCTMDL